MRSKLVPAGLFDVDTFRTALGDVVVCKGVFDLTHAGHVQLFQRAAKLGDSLVVLVADDSSVRRCKGAYRPVLSLDERLIVLGEFSSVDWLVAYDLDYLVDALLQIRPMVFCASHFAALGSRLDEVRRAGVHLVQVPKPSFQSTTDLVVRMQRTVRNE